MQSQIYYLVLFISIHLSCCLVNINNLTFHWQIHSQDDLREWPQLLKKQSHYFKIDVNYQKPDYCVKQNEPDKSDPRGCFILIHTNPSLNQLHYYNSPTDFQNFLIENKDYFSSDIKAHIALCFKNGPITLDSCILKEDWEKNWVSLVDDLYNTFQKNILTHNLNLEYILDGSGVKDICFYKRWKPWVYTWIEGQDPQLAYIMNDQFDRFQIFNDAERMIKIDEDTDWGKFKNINRPLQVWEPSDQPTIEKIAKYFTSRPHQAGYAYAINIDPAMYSIYVGNISNEAWNVQLIPEATGPQIAIFPVGNNWGEDVEYFIFYQKNEINYYSQFQNSGVRGDVAANGWISKTEQKINWTTEKIQLLSKLVCTKQEVSTGICTENTSYLIASTANQYALYEFDGTNLNFIGANNLTRTQEQLTLISSNGANLNCLAAVSATIENDYLNFSKIQIQISNGQFISETILPSIKLPMLIDQFSLAYLPLTSTTKLQEFLFTFHSLEDTILQYKIQLNSTFNNLQKLSGQMIGQSFSSSTVSSVTFQMVSGGQCFNNEQANKNPTVSICDDTIIAHDFILNYFVFHVENREINNLKQNSNITACWNQEGIVGTIGLGNNAAIDGYFEKGERAAFVQVFEGWNGEGDLEYCGVSEQFNGIVLTSFVLPDNYSPGISKNKHQHQIKKKAW